MEELVEVIVGGGARLGLALGALTLVSRVGWPVGRGLAEAGLAASAWLRDQVAARPEALEDIVFERPATSEGTAAPPPAR